MDCRQEVLLQRGPREGDQGNAAREEEGGVGRGLREEVCLWDSRQTKGLDWRVSVMCLWKKGKGGMAG